MKRRIARLWIPVVTGFAGLLLLLLYHHGALDASGLDIDNGSANKVWEDNQVTAQVPLAKTDPGVGRPVFAVRANSTFTLRGDSDRNPVFHSHIAGVAREIDSLDPALTSDPGSLLVANQIYDTLFDYDDEEFQPEEGLVENWTASVDQLTWNLDLRSGVKFHDGTDLDADAVIFNMQRWWDPAHPQHNGDFSNFVEVFGGYKDSGSTITNLRTIGSLKVRITLSEPVEQLPTLLMHPSFSIASPSAIEGGRLITEPVGSGPFKFEGWNQAGNPVLSKNADYWGNGALLDKLTFTQIPDQEERYHAVLVNDIQSAFYLLPEYGDRAAGESILKVLWPPGTARNASDTSPLIVRQNVTGTRFSPYGGVDFSQVHYIPGFAVYFPYVSFNSCGGFLGPMEVENNDNFLEANGELCYGFDYSGNVLDENESGQGENTEDWYFIYWNGEGTLIVEVTDFPAKAQVRLYPDPVESGSIASSVDQADGHYRLEYVGQSIQGRYYIRLFVPWYERPPDGSVYRLRITPD